MKGGAVVVYEPSRKVAFLEPVDRAVAEDDRGNAGRVGLDTRSGGDGCHLPGARRGAAGAGIDDVVALASPVSASGAPSYWRLRARLR